MDALQFFALRYDGVHRGFTTTLLDGLTDDQLRRRPHGVNSIAWLLWHMARCEDVGVNRFVADRHQVLDDEGWPPRLHVPRRDIGTGMTSAEVDELSARIDTAALRAYWDAVYHRTKAVLLSLQADDLDAPIDPATLQRVIVEEGVLGPQAGWVADFWAKAQPNRGWMLAHLALTHHHGHFYEALVTRGLLGFPFV